MLETLRPDIIAKAMEDYKYLIDRGYGWKPALNLITGRYMLSKSERALLFRAVHPSDLALNIRNKIQKPEEIKGLVLGVDGYNVLITLETLIRKGLVVKCDDGLLRDLQGLFYRYKVSEYTYRALSLMEEFVSKFNPSKTLVYLDRRKSRSGELARTIRLLARNFSVYAVERADVKASESQVTATSDIVPLTKAKKIVDIPGYFVSRYTVNSVRLKYDGCITLFNLKPSMG